MRYDDGDLGALDVLLRKQPSHLGTCSDDLEIVRTDSHRPRLFRTGWRPQADGQASFRGDPAEASRCPHKKFEIGE